MLHLTRVKLKVYLSLIGRMTVQRQGANYQEIIVSRLEFADFPSLDNQKNFFHFRPNFLLFATLSFAP